MKNTIFIEIFGCETLCDFETMLSNAMKNRIHIQLHQASSPERVLINGVELQQPSISSIIDAINNLMYMPSAA